MYNLGLISLDQPKLGDSLQNTWSGIFKNIKKHESQGNTEEPFQTEGDWEKAWLTGQNAWPYNGCLCYIVNYWDSEQNWNRVYGFHVEVLCIIFATFM